MQAIINILNSLVGFVLAVLIVVAAAAIVGYNAIRVQKSTATTFYTIDSQSLKKKDFNNHQAFQTIKE
ncbi:DUF4006 family protein [Helicobacter sp. MIT 14-3879]|uniref:DUF4006 family protein n=1 Tax=Helicobacter sp. MIT 14-3879 TaxID=2040649 RepID=UPI000E1FAC03|nr:DUF4006 family protein [Helicobacter sp. MIT 14-3879]RDU61454.1 DUF4006 domain-containing protein [Helicobacter sp. MIT 14-3879]